MQRLTERVGTLGDAPPPGGNANQWARAIRGGLQQSFQSRGWPKPHSPETTETLNLPALSWSRVSAGGASNVRQPIRGQSATCRTTDPGLPTPLHCTSSDLAEAASRLSEAEADALRRCMGQLRLAAPLLPRQHALLQPRRRAQLQPWVQPSCWPSTRARPPTRQEPQNSFPESLSSDSSSSRRGR